MKVIELKKKLQDQRNQMLYDLFENEQIIHRDVIYQLVIGIRSINKFMEMVKE